MHIDLAARAASGYRGSHYDAYRRMFFFSFLSLAVETCKATLLPDWVSFRSFRARKPLTETFKEVKRNATTHTSTGNSRGAAATAHRTLHSAVHSVYSAWSETYTLGPM